MKPLRHERRLASRSAARRGELLPPVREPGFYWVHLSTGGDWQPGEYDGRLWWLPGGDLPLDDVDLVKGERLVPPA